MSENLRRMIRKLEGDGPLQKEQILLKLTDLSENSPNPTDATFEAATPERQWLSKIHALLLLFT